MTFLQHRSTISRATRPDQAVVTASIAELPGLLDASALPGPVLVMIGNAVSSANDEGSRRIQAITDMA